MMAVERIDYEKCNSCGLCRKICPMDVFDHFDRLYYIAHQKDCMTCFLCQIECPQEAVDVGPFRATEVPFPY